MPCSSTALDFRMASFTWESILVLGSVGCSHSIVVIAVELAAHHSLVNGSGSSYLCTLQIYIYFLVF